jgi:hypothetical protein
MSNCTANPPNNGLFQDAHYADERLTLKSALPLSVKVSRIYAVTDAFSIAGRDLPESNLPGKRRSMAPGLWQE